MTEEGVFVVVVVAVAVVVVVVVVVVVAVAAVVVVVDLLVVSLQRHIVLPRVDCSWGASAHRIYLVGPPGLSVNKFIVTVRMRMCVQGGRRANGDAEFTSDDGDRVSLPTASIIRGGQRRRVTGGEERDGNGNGNEAGRRGRERVRDRVRVRQSEPE